MTLSGVIGYFSKYPLDDGIIDGSRLGSIAELEKTLHMIWYPNGNSQ